MNIEDKLKQVRIKNGYTQNDIADALGIERSTYAYYELGKNQIPLKHLYSLSYVYDIDIKWFLEENNNYFILHDDSCFTNGKRNDDDNQETGNSIVLSQAERVFLAKVRIIVGRNKGYELHEFVEKLLQEE